MATITLRSEKNCQARLRWRGRGTCHGISCTRHKHGSSTNITCTMTCNGCIPWLPIHEVQLRWPNCFATCTWCNACPEDWSTVDLTTTMRAGNLPRPQVAMNTAVHMTRNWNCAIFTMYRIKYAIMIALILDAHTWPSQVAILLTISWFTQCHETFSFF